MRKSLKALVAGGAAVAAVATVGAFGTVAANADPTNSWAAGDIVVVGSNTIEQQYDAFGNGFTDPVTHATFTPTSDGTDLIRSWDSVPQPSSINPTGTNSFTRPNGSGDGRHALSAAWDPSNDVWNVGGNTFHLRNQDVTIARSSALNGTATAYDGTSDLDFVPLARDAVGVAVKSVSLSDIGNLNTDQLEAIYGGALHPTGNYHQNGNPSVFTVGDIVRGAAATDDPSYVQAVDGSGTITNSIQLHPLLPQSSSGTRQFFLNAVSSSNTSPATWVDPNAGEENTFTTLAAAGDIIPFSGAAAVAQSHGVYSTGGFTGVTFPTITDFSGTAKTLLTNPGLPSAQPGTLFGDFTNTGLGNNPAGDLPNYAFNSGDFRRDVYSVIPTSQEATTYDGQFLIDIVSTILPGETDSAGNALTGDLGFKPLPRLYSSDPSVWFQSPWDHS